MAQQPVSGLKLMEEGVGTRALARYNPDVTAGAFPILSFTLT